MSTVICKDIEGDTFEVDVAELQLHASTYGIVIRDDTVLLFKQRNGYDLPGGGVEFGELLEDAVIREVKEETGLTVANPRLVKANTSFFKLSGGQPKPYLHSLMLYYVCDFVGGEFSSAGFDEWEKGYSLGAEWVPLSELDSIKVGSSKDYRAIIKEVAGI